MRKEIRKHEIQAPIYDPNEEPIMDNIIRSVDGDMAIVMPSLTDNNMQMTMAAKLSHAKWLGSE